MCRSPLRSASPIIFEELSRVRTLSSPWDGDTYKPAMGEANVDQCLMTFRHPKGDFFASPFQGTKKSV